MGGISNDNILKFVLGISGLGLSLASFTLSRVFALEDYSHALSEKSGETVVRMEYNKVSIKNLEDANIGKSEKISILETRILILEENMRQIKATTLSSSNDAKFKQ